MAFLQRARNEGGTNSLRGKKKYNCKVKCGPWVEASAEPGPHQASGFPHPFFSSSAHEGMQAGLGIKPRRFGAALQPPEHPRIDYRNVINYDKEQRDSCWKTITSSSHDGKGGSGQEFKPSFHLMGGIQDKKELREYRATWTTETDAIRDVRFKTDATESANAGVEEPFKRVQTRALPGTPLAVERLREQVLANGKMGLRNIRRVLHLMDESGDGRLQPDELKRGLQGMDIGVTAADMEQVMKFFDKDGDGVVSLREFLKGLRGPMNSKRTEAVHRAFEALDHSGDEEITVDDLRAIFRVTSHPDVEAGRATEEEVYQRFLSQWDCHVRDGKVSFEEFLDYFGDISASVADDRYFVEMVEKAWGLTTCL